MTSDEISSPTEINEDQHSDQRGHDQYQEDETHPLLLSMNGTHNEEDEIEDIELDEEGGETRTVTSNDSNGQQPTTPVSQLGPNDHCQNQNDESSTAADIATADDHCLNENKEIQIESEKDNMQYNGSEIDESNMKKPIGDNENTVRSEEVAVDVQNLEPKVPDLETNAEPAVEEKAEKEDANLVQNQCNEPILTSNQNASQDAPIVQSNSPKAMESNPAVDPDPGVESMEQHWLDAIYEVQNARVHHWNIAGGSDFGQFGYLMDSGDIILEVDGVKVAGVTRIDLINLITAKETHHLKAVSSSSSAHGLPLDLRDYLSRRFVRGSLDHELQATIRENVYLRTIPCTTRPPKPNERDGIDYKFLSKEAFKELEKSGGLLESGTFDGHYYGTLMPVSLDMADLDPKLQHHHAQHHIINEADETEADQDVSGAPVIMDSEPVIPEVTIGTWNEAIMTPELDSEANKVSETVSKLNVRSMVSHFEKLVAFQQIAGRNQDYDYEAAMAAVESLPLPQGWDQVQDPHFGVYYVDHVNQRTQYERPFDIELIKGHHGFGVTLIEVNGGHIMVKNIIEGSPAFNAGILQPGDILVSVAGVSVNGLQQADISRLFGVFAVGDQVRLTFARGHYPVMAAFNRLRTRGRCSQAEETREDENGGADEMELLRVPIEKGPNGFGFTICDAGTCQRVKKVLDIPRCGSLRQGDILIMFNSLDVRNMNHVQVVCALKSFPVGECVKFTIQRKKQFRSKTPVPPPPPKVSLNGHGLNPALSKSVSRLPPPDTNGWLPPTQGTAKHMSVSQPTIINGVNGNHYPPTNGSSSGLETSVVSSRGSNGHSSLDSGIYLTPIPTNRRHSTSARLTYTSSTPNLLDASINGHVNGYSSVAIAAPKPLTQGLLQPVYKPVSLKPSLSASTPLITPSAPVRKPVSEDDDYEYHRVQLFRNEDGFGFRIVGGAEEHRNVTVGSIIIGGVAFRDGTLKAGDEIISVNGMHVLGSSHRYVAELMGQCERVVTMMVRRRKYSDAYDVNLNRSPDEGFGFVIISCGAQALIGRIIPGSPADRCRRLHIRDRIIAVNNIDVTAASHPHIVSIIKDSGQTLQLKIVPANCYSVELMRGSRGFGFSIRGGAEFGGMPLYVLRISPDGPSANLLTVGDEIIEINGQSTGGMTHYQAVQVISHSGLQVRMRLIRRNGAPIPDLNVVASQRLALPHRPTSSMMMTRGPANGHLSSSYLPYHNQPQVALKPHPPLHHSSLFDLSSTHNHQYHQIQVPYHQPLPHHPCMMPQPQPIQLN